MSQVPPRVRRHRARRQRSRWAVAILVIGGFLVIGALVRQRPDANGAQLLESLPPTVTAAPPVQPSVSTAPVLQMAGDFAKSGPETFSTEKTSGDVLGTAGNLKRFRIAVESNVADAEIAEFTRMVDLTLGDSRSWIAGKQVRFQRVADGQPYDFTIHLVTRDTAHKMCGTSGLDIRQNGIPYTSCQQTRKVIINLDRWRLSIPDYVKAGIPLHNYRQYVINHEVGHELGRGHESCPGKGQPAPTMFRQTLGLHGCTANAWPYLDGKRYEGSPVA